MSQDADGHEPPTDLRERRSGVPATFWRRLSGGRRPRPIGRVDDEGLLDRLTEYVGDAESERRD
jgi:hypothetical protein